jgi:hypothetical protein
VSGEISLAKLRDGVSKRKPQAKKRVLLTQKICLGHSSCTAFLHRRHEK